MSFDFKSALQRTAEERKAKYAKILAESSEEELQAPIISVATQPAPSFVSVPAAFVGNPASAEKVPAGDVLGMSGEAIEYTDEQLAAIDLACKGKSFCLIGSAGTGKTTTVRAVAMALINRQVIRFLRSGTSTLDAGSPSIAFVAYTNRAVENMRKSLPRDYQNNACTIHKLLEPKPVYTDYVDAKGNPRKKLEFVFSRNATNPIEELQCVVVEESSMVSVELHRDLRMACPNAFFIYLGDLNQLQPVYGPAILGFRLLTLPVVELTKVWRQALDSEIIRLAQHIKDGKYPNKLWLSENLHNGQIELRPYAQSRGKEATMVKFSFHIRKELINEFNPETDIMLCPQNVGFGSDEINKVFAQVLGERRQAMVYEIIGGYNKHYLAVGDKVMFNKRDFIIEEIKFNSRYTGQLPQPPSQLLDRWGRSTELRHTVDGDADADMEALAAALNINIEADDIEEKVNQASHVLSLRPLWPLYENEKAEVKTAGDLNSVQLSYCISVHKAQGSEWDKVYVVMHKSHGRMLSRELLYTAVTRAKNKLVLYYDPDSTSLSTDGNLTTSVRNVGIRGTTIKAKAEYFKGKLDRMPDDLKEHLLQLEEESEVK